MGRNWKITPEQAQIFVDELMDQIARGDMNESGMFIRPKTDIGRHPASWPQFFRALAAALEMNRVYRTKTPLSEFVPTDEMGRTRGEV